MHLTRTALLVCSLALTLAACGGSTPNPSTQQTPANEAATASEMTDGQARSMLQAQSVNVSVGTVSEATYAFKGSVLEGPSKGTVLEGDLALKLRALPNGRQFLEGTLSGSVPVRGILFRDGSSILLFDVKPEGIIGRGVRGRTEALSGVFFGPNISGGDQGTWTAALKTTPPPTAQKGEVRALHASSDTPAVDLLIDGVKVSPAGGFTFRNVFPSSGYAKLDAGRREIKVCAAGTTVCPVQAGLRLKAGERLTVAVIGTLSADDDHGATPRPLKPLVLEDDADSKPTKAQVRLVHAAANPAANRVDVYVTAPGVSLEALKPAIAGFRYSTDSGYLPLEPGDYQVRITLPGTKTVVIDSGKLSLAAGKVFSAFAVDPLPGSKDFGAVLLQDN